MPILIINHDAVFLSQVQEVFEAQGHQVIATTNSLQAIPFFYRYKPRIVILNISMPNKDGFEIVKEIRAICQKTFILAVSSNPFYLRAIKKLGANESLPYFISPSLIMKAIPSKATG